MEGSGDRPHFGAFFSAILRRWQYNDKRLRAGDRSRTLISLECACLTCSSTVQQVLEYFVSNIGYIYNYTLFCALQRVPTSSSSLLTDNVLPLYKSSRWWSEQNRSERSRDLASPFNGEKFHLSLLPRLSLSFR